MRVKFGPPTGQWRSIWRDMQATNLVVLPGVAGALTGVVAIGFVELLNLVQWLAIGSTDLPLNIVPHLPWYHVLLVPALGGLLVGPLVRYFAPEAAGHGVPEVIEAVAIGGGRVRRRIAVVKSIASALTIGTGGSVGREGPIVQIGAAVGSALGQFLRQPAAQLKTLAACGAAGGIAAVFNAPIAGAFFAVEVIVGNFAMPAFGPVILASVVATVVSRAYFGDHPAFVVQPYQLTSSMEIAIYLPLGVLCGIVAAAFIWSMDQIETRVKQLPIPPMWRPAVGGLAVGALILFLPNLYGVGYGTMDAALGGTLPWGLLVLLIPAKILATCVTLASGGSGGVFLPSLFLGAATGGLFGTAAHSLLPDYTSGSGAYALVGMAGVLSAATHSPITSILMLFEITGNYQIILPVMMVTTVATIVGRGLSPESIYSMALSRRGIDLHRREDLVMRSHTVGSVMRPAGAVVSENALLDDVVHRFLESDILNLYVANAAGQFVGVIGIQDIKDPSMHALGPLVIAGDVVDRAASALSPIDTLAQAIERFVLSEDDELPVVDSEKHLVGVVSRRDVLRVYSSELVRHEYLGVTTRGDETGQPAHAVRLATGTVIEQIPVPSSMVYRSLRDANLRSAHNLTVVAVRRAGSDEEELPSPDALLQPGEVLVVVGRPADIETLRCASTTKL